MNTADRDATQYDDLAKLNYFLKFAPSGTSFRSFIHYGQLISEDKLNPGFPKYDFGSNKRNKLKYCPNMDMNDETQICKPPRYNLRRV